MTANAEAPTLTPPKISLLTAADIVPLPIDPETGLTDRRWESGFRVWTEGCEVAYIYEICPPSDADPKSSDGQGEEVQYQPYVIYASDACSTFSASRDFWGRATRKLILAESTKLERELWLGEAGGNPFLSDTPTTLVSGVGGTLEPWQAIGILDQALGECSAGRGMIHIRPFLLPFLQEHRAVRREGNIYLSPMDNIIVPGRGYPGTGPADEAIGVGPSPSEWMYANTGIVQIRHSEVIYTPRQADEGAQYVWTTNDRAVRAERISHVALDPTCCVLAIEVASLAVS